MLGIGLWEIIVIIIVFITIIKPKDYGEIISGARKIATTCLNIKKQVMNEIDDIATKTNIKKDIEDIISDLADGEILDDQGIKHKYYKLDAMLPKFDKENLK